MTYKTILADPPWEERGGGKIPRGAQRHYPLMKKEEIMALPIQQFVDPVGCHLYLWVTNGFLPAGLEVMKAWGFRYVTNITWAKDRMGIGQYFRGKSEQCLFGVAGRLPYKKDPVTGKRMQGTTLICAPRKEHSAKPPEMRQMIERVSYGPFLELFAREKAPGWHTWGNEVPNDIRMDNDQRILQLP